MLYVQNSMSYEHVVMTQRQKNSILSAFQYFDGFHER